MTSIAHKAIKITELNTSRQDKKSELRRLISAMIDEVERSIKAGESIEAISKEFTPVLNCLSNVLSQHSSDYARSLSIIGVSPARQDVVEFCLKSEK